MKTTLRITLKRLDPNTQAEGLQRRRVLQLNTFVVHVRIAAFTLSRVVEKSVSLRDEGFQRVFVLCLCIKTFTVL